MGVRVAASNWSEAFTTPGVWLARSLSAPRWVVARVSAPRAVSDARIAAGERRALGRIGAAPHLVQQHQRAGIRVVQDRGAASRRAR